MIRNLLSVSAFVAFLCSCATSPQATFAEGLSDLLEDDLVVVQTGDERRDALARLADLEKSVSTEAERRREAGGAESITTWAALGGTIVYGVGCFFPEPGTTAIGCTNMGIAASTLIGQAEFERRARAERKQITTAISSFRSKLIATHRSYEDQPYAFFNMNAACPGFERYNSSGERKAMEIVAEIADEVDFRPELGTRSAEECASISKLLDDNESRFKLPGFGFVFFSIR